MKNWQKYNLNQKVKIKLTDFGREKLKEDYVLPITEEDGWSEWQLWEVIGYLGKYYYMGGTVPFETTIKLENNIEDFI